MRINRLDLTRYGRFTDYVLDFSCAQKDKPDLHIVYGANEAGKSTTFSALLDLLFGIEHTSRYNFLHPYPAMRIGASLQLQNGAQELVRTKARQNSLRDDQGQVLPESLIAAELGDIDRHAYRMMFSLDDDTLEQGGEAILASKGNLGELLFSASAGLAGLSQNLALLRARADQFYRHGARSGELADLKAQLQDIETQKAALDAHSSAQAYAKLAGAHQQAQETYQQALRDHSNTKIRKSELEAQLKVLPWLHQLQEMRIKLEAYADVPAIPAGWADELPKLMMQDAELRTSERILRDRYEEQLREIAALAPDENALRLAASVENLQDARARFLTAQKDLPEREAALYSEQQAIEALLLRLGRSDEKNPHDLLINIQTEAQLRSLIESRSGIEASLRLTHDELASAKEQLAFSREERDMISGCFDEAQAMHFAALDRLLLQLRHEDHTAFLQQADYNVREEQAGLQEMWQAFPLRPVHIAEGAETAFPEAVDELAQLDVPDIAMVENVDAALHDLQSRLRNTEAMLEASCNEAAELNAQLAALQDNNLLVTEKQAEDLRRARDEAWQQHRTMLSVESADKFEQLLLRDDRVVHSRLTQAAELARAFSIREKLAVIDVKIRAAQESQANLLIKINEQKQNLKEWQNRLLPHYKEELPARSLKYWLEKREALLQKRSLFLRACRVRDERLQHMQNAANTLIQQFDLLGITPEGQDLASLLQQASSVNEQYQQVASLQAEWEEQYQNVQQRRKKADAAAKADAEWQQAWQLACAGTWLGKETIPALDLVRQMLDLVAKLAPALERRDGLWQSIIKMRDDQAAYRAAVEDLAQRLSLPLQAVNGQALSLMEIAAQLEDAVRKAVAQHKTLQDLQYKSEQTERDLQDLAQQIAVADAGKTEIIRYFDVDDLAQAGQKMQAAKEKADLQAACVAEEQNITSSLKTDNLEEAEVLLAGADSAALKQQLAELTILDDAQDQEKQEHYRLWKEAEQRLREAQAGDESAARLDEQRHTLLLEIEEKSRHYLRLRFGINAAEQALHLYRDKHRSTMMTKASEAFAMISRGAYRGLTTQIDKDNEILIATGSDGSSKMAGELSKGTRFQLYLSLRIAGYYEFISAQRPMPFIADDVLETFDDDRSRETFRILAQMAHHGQVIYLTHHRHLCDIAREICPDVQIHALHAEAA